MNCKYIASLGFLLLFNWCTVSATTIHVPGDQPTIQDAIDLAANGDTVLVADGTFKGEGNRDLNPGGKQIIIESENGYENCIIDVSISFGSKSYRCFNFISGEGYECIIRGFTLTGGTRDYGAAINCENSSPLFQECLITGNNSQKSGGGVYCHTSSPLFQDCIFQNNTAEYGGAAFCGVELGTVVFYGCVFSGNSTPDCGGAICGYGGTLELRNCNLSDNHAMQDGGGIYTSGSKIKVYSCELSNNSAQSSGGAMYSNLGTMVIGGSSEDGNYFSGNRAGDGADFAYDGNRHNVATHNRFNGFFQSDYYVSPLAKFNVDSCICQRTPITRDVYVSTNGNNNNDGLTPATAFKTIQHALSSIVATPAQPITVHVAAGEYSPSLTGEQYPLPVMGYVTIAGAGRNHTILNVEETGRGIYSRIDPGSRVSSLTVKNGLIDRGAGFYVDDSTVVVTDCDITANTVTSDGGGIYCFSDAAPTFSNCTLDQNVADSEGGGFYCMYDCFPRFILCRFTGNSSGYTGGAIQCVNTSHSAFNHCIIQGNSTVSEGGGIFCRYWSSATFTSCIVAENTADRGAGIYCNSQGDALFYNCVLKNNTASIEGGFGYHRDDSAIALSNCNILNNSAAQSGGAFYSWSSELNAKYSIIRSNSPDLAYSKSAAISVSYSCVQDGFNGPGNFDTDPLFTTVSPQDCYLSNLAAGQTELSPCIDAGNVAAQDLVFNTSCGSLCMGDLWTRTDGVPDSGMVDAGAHYPLPGDTIPTIEITMPDDQFSAGDPCGCDLIIQNNSLMTIHGYPSFVLLEIGGHFYFAPSYSEFDYLIYQFPSGTHRQAFIPEFTWPTGTGSGSATWYCALTDPGFTTLCSPLSTFSFDWSE